MPGKGSRGHVSKIWYEKNPSFRLSVQRSAGDLHILAGVFPETAILTVHNCDLEVVPQSAFKLPRGADRILILNKVMVVSSVSGDIGRRKHALHIVSSFHSELHLVHELRTSFAEERETVMSL